MVRWIATCIAILAASISLAQVTDGKTAQLSPKLLARIKKTKYRVLVPTYLPAGFRIKTADLAIDKSPDLTNWYLSYENPKTKAMITIQMASEGLGDPMFDLPNGDVADPTGSIWAKNPILGKVNLEYLVKGPIRMSQCTWYDASKTTYPRVVMIFAHNVDAKVTKKVLESLRWLKV